jgi:hypothetical protein
VNEIRTTSKAAVALGAAVMMTTSCGGKKEEGVSPQLLADAVYGVVSADRAVYAREVVTRLSDNDKVIQASEHFKDERTLPLPAQMFRMGAEQAKKNGAQVSYALISLWPINSQNNARTEAEKTGLKSVVETGKNFYTHETLGGKKYFTAIYPDKAAAQACASCHNQHQDSPKKDFKLGDVMGGVVVRVPLDK